MTDIQTLGVNEKLLRGAEKDLRNLQLEARAVDQKFMVMFPGKDEAWVREAMIRAKVADIAQYKSLVAFYREKLGMRG